KIDAAGEGGGLQFAEVVGGAAVVGRDRDRRELVVRRRAAECAGRVLAVEVAGGLRLADRVGAGPQSGERVIAGGVGGGADAHRVPQVVGAAERDRRAANARVPCLAAVVVGVKIDAAGE